MSRSIPWRNRMPHHLFELVEQAQRTRLYMVNEWGPTSFTLRDEPGHKYKVTIGSSVLCSCNPSRNDHCLHSLFLLLKMFRVDRTNPILWQASYLDSELKALCEGKYGGLRGTRPSFAQPVRPPSQAFIDLPLRSKGQPVQDQPNRLPLDADSFCPICQQPMDQSQPLSYCRVVCGNNFHIKCLKVWGEHKLQTPAVITCPMCRAPWQNLFTHLRQDQRRFRQTHSGQGSCSHCGDSLLSARFKCLFCQKYELCPSCYASPLHQSHDRWLSRHDDCQDWTPAAPRSGKGEVTPTLQQYLMDSFKHASADLMEEMKKNELGGVNKYECSICGCNKLMKLRILECGHMLDESCLQPMIAAKWLYCPVLACKRRLLKGFDLAKSPKPEQPVVSGRLSDLVGGGLGSKMDVIRRGQNQRNQLRTRYPRAESERQNPGARATSLSVRNHYQRRSVDPPALSPNITAIRREQPDRPPPELPQLEVQHGRSLFVAATQRTAVASPFVPIQAIIQARNQSRSRRQQGELIEIVERRVEQVEGRRREREGTARRTQQRLEQLNSRRRRGLQRLNGIVRQAGQFNEHIKALVGQQIGVRQ